MRPYPYHITHREANAGSAETPRERGEGAGLLTPCGRPRPYSPISRDAVDPARRSYRSPKALMASRKPSRTRTDSKSTAPM